MSIDDAQVGLDELGSHLARHYKDVYQLNWRRFEELVADVYRNLGYEVRLTAASRDDGYDVLLLERATSEQILVECKRHSENRKVGIAIVDRLLGVMLRRKVSKAKLVTTSTFTRGAVRAANLATKANQSIELDLVDAAGLVTALGVYNTSLPPLDLHMRDNARDFDWPAAKPLS